MATPLTQVSSTEDDSTQAADKRPLKPKKKFDFTEYLQKNSYIDTRDSVDTWRVAKILEVSTYDSTIKVRFDGWSGKWDEVSLCAFLSLCIWLINSVNSSFL